MHPNQPYPLTSVLLFVCTILLVSPGIYGLKCFTCMYDSEDVVATSGLDSDGISSLSSPSLQCLKDSPSIRLLKDCGHPYALTGINVCVNSTLIVDSKIVEISRNCQEKMAATFNSNASHTGCLHDPSDDFTTCTCLTDGCNVPYFDVKNNEEVDDEEAHDKKSNHENDEKKDDLGEKNKDSAGISVNRLDITVILNFLCHVYAAFFFFR